MKTEGSVSYCRLCHKMIVWRKVEGAVKPFDAERPSVSHFQTCTVYREKCRKRDEKKRAERERRQGRVF